jgi:SAM-dependent methyltransferase
MYQDALGYLTCPRHQTTRLELLPGAHRAADGELIAGELRCSGCTRAFPLRDGIADLLGPRVLPDSPAQLTNYLPITAWAYERTWRPRALTLLSGEPFGYDRELPLIVGLAAPERGGLLLDVACSNGLYARALDRARVDAPGHVIGVDHAMPMLRQARAYARAAGVRISYVRAKAQALPVAPGSAAAVVMGGSLNEIGDTDQALRELRRALAPAGRCVIMCLVQGDTLPGRTLQRSLGLGGLDVPPLDRLNLRFAGAELRLRAQWRHGVVLFSLLAGRGDTGQALVG